MSLLVVGVVIAFAADSSWSLDALPSVRRMTLEVLAAAHGSDGAYSYLFKSGPC